MPEKVRLGFIGCGFMGQCVHLPSFKKVKNAEIIAISDLRPKLAKAVAERWKIRKVYPSHLEMIEDKEIDAIVEITNKFLHTRIAVDALKAGKHVFTEKPIATTSKDALEMVRAAEKKDLKLMVGYMKRYDTGVLKAKEAYEEFISHDKVTWARSHIFGGGRASDTPAEQMITTDEKNPEIEPRYPDFLPKNLTTVMNDLLEVLVHYINLPRYFLGDPAAVDSFKFWPSGSMAVLNYGDYPLITEFFRISSDFWDEQTQLYFKDGWIKMRPPPLLMRNMAAKVDIYRAGETQRDEFPHGSASYGFEREAQHFIDCIVDDKEPISSGADSYKDIVIIESMLKALIENKRIEIEF